MNSLAGLLKDYVVQNPPACGDAQAVIDKIYWACMESNRMDGERINRLYKNLRAQIKLPQREYDEVLYTISDLNIEYGRHAFSEGLKVGLVLLHESST